jgi:hypothetical protein
MKKRPPTDNQKGRFSKADPSQAKPTLSSRFKSLPARFRRLAHALLERPCSTRELKDILPANNGPHYIAMLRKRGLTIPCERIRFITKDGVPSWYGRYSLTDDDKAKLSVMFGGVV